MSDTQTSLLPLAFHEFTVPATVRVPATQALLDRVSDDLDMLGELDIDSEDMAALVLEMLGRVSTVHDTMDRERLDTTKPYREVVGEINGGYSPAIEHIAKVMKASKEKLTAWNRRVAAEKDRIEREARQRAKAEMAAAEKLQAEKQREADDLQRQARQAAARGEASLAAALVDDARQLVESAQSEAHIAAISANAPTLGSVPAGVKGATLTWHGALESLEELILGIAEQIAGLDPGSLKVKHGSANIGSLEANMVFINKKASIEKEHFKLRGCKGVAHEGVRVATRAV